MSCIKPDAVHKISLVGITRACLGFCNSVKISFVALFALVLASTSLSAASTDEKIAKQSITLNQNSQDQEQISKKLEDLADDILRKNKRLDELSAQISALSAKVEQLKKTKDNQSSLLDELSSQNKELIQNKKELERTIIRLIADEFAYDMLADTSYAESEHSIIKTHALDGLSKVLRGEFVRLSKDYESTITLINQKQIAINKLKANLNEYQKQAIQLNELKLSQLQELKKQQQNEQIYKQRLLALQKQQQQIRQTLKDLKILSEQERTKKQKALEAKQKAQQEKALKDIKDAEVKQLGSSYQITKSTHFKGAKTIAPLKSYTIKQRFGSYTDPIYHIKIYNENVILKSTEKNAQVRAVLGGKIVFAKETAVLGKVVIIEHKDGLHTIYANLISIPSTIKVGAMVKQGNVIGRVYEDLAFEVTKKNAHINPLELIK